MLTFLLHSNNDASTPEAKEVYKAQLPQLEERLKLIDETFLKEIPVDKRGKIRKTATQIAQLIKKLKKLSAEIEAVKKCSQKNGGKASNIASKLLLLLMPTSGTSRFTLENRGSREGAKKERKHLQN